MNKDDLLRATVEALKQSGNESLARQMEDVMASKYDRVLFETPWLELRETPDNYIYSHEAKSNGQAVAVLAYRNDGKLEVVGRYERCPCHHDGFALTSLTGMVEDESPVDAAVRELQEEAGIEVDKDEMRFLGIVRPSKQSDTAMHLFAVNVGDRDIGEIVGDGTKGEEGAYCKWVSLREASRSKSPVLSAMILRVMVT